MTASPPHHRSDIDGLRAIAVVAVLMFHAGFSAFPGGYVGVDVFFVISGFLITQIILREIASGSFSMKRFYERRIRRIFPALAATLLVTLALGLFLLPPHALTQLGRSVVAVSFFSSNILFWKTAGYFGPTAEQLPLLHTWSLAVEEQFYILYPLFLLAIHRYLRGKFRVWVAVATILSFLFGVWLTRNDATAAFYVAPTRAWQLLCGALVACNFLPPVRHALVRELLAAAGMVAILASVVLYTADTLFPGTAALLPTLGAASVIYAGNGPTTIVGKVLGTRPIAFIGAISYSLYLVHWPVFVFAKHYAIVELTPAQTVWLLVLCMALAVLSWRYVEQPFRAGPQPGVRHPVRVALLGMVVLAVAGGGLQLTKGLPGLFPDLALVDDPALEEEWTRWRRCNRRILREGMPCAIGTTGSVAPTFILWGDSHARAVAPGLHLSASNLHRAGFLADADGCPPLLGLGRRGHEWCVGNNNKVLAFIAARPDVRTVILVSRWPAYVFGRLPKEAGGRTEIVDYWEPALSPNDHATALRRGLLRTVSRLVALGRDVVIVDEIPEVGYDVPTAYGVALRTGRDVNRLIAPTRAKHLWRTRGTSASLLAMDSLPNVRLMRLSASMCDTSSCRIIHNGRPLYMDGNHLSAYGARSLAPVFDSLFVTLR